MRAVSVGVKPSGSTQGAIGGGARVARVVTCAKIEVIAASTLSAPSQRGQMLTSMQHTQRSRCIHVIAAREARALGSSAAPVERGRHFATTSARCWTLGATVEHRFDRRKLLRDRCF
jgi:hypothetical protein